ncbi:undecaprenyl-diphosphatase [Paenibacillus mucilaginosus]|uniref:phosphatase PAP2 family protein n=1 Tax=Paenibacillus mucilaginosus TaxID=61624 RepID=UPI003D2053B6
MKHIGWMLVIAILFGVIAVVVIPAQGPAAWDRQAAELLGADRQGEPSGLLLALNMLGSTAALAGVALLSAAAAWWLHSRRAAAAVLGTVIAAMALNRGLKTAIGRPRPDHAGWVEATGYSFPSGNAMIGMALYGILAFVIWKYARSGALRLAGTAAGAAVILILGYCRLYFGVHYLTDIAAGYLGGLFCITGAAGWLKAFETRLAQRRSGTRPRVM